MIRCRTTRPDGSREIMTSTTLPRNATFTSLRYDGYLGRVGANFGTKPSSSTRRPLKP
jgi:hypothetical protein